MAESGSRVSGGMQEGSWDGAHISVIGAPAIDGIMGRGGLQGGVGPIWVCGYVLRSLRQG